MRKSHMDDEDSHGTDGFKMEGFRSLNFPGPKRSGAERPPGEHAGVGRAQGPVRAYK